MKKHAGFTLIELIIGIAIMLIIFGGLVYIFGASTKSAQAGMNHKQAYEAGRQMMDEIKTTLRYADTDTVKLDETNGTLTYSTKDNYPFFDKHWDIANGVPYYYSYSISWKDSNKTQLKIEKTITNSQTAKSTTTTTYYPTDEYVSANGAFKSTDYNKLGKAFPIYTHDFSASVTGMINIAIPFQYKDGSGTNKVEILQTEVTPTTYGSTTAPTTQAKANILIAAATAMYKAGKLVKSDGTYVSQISSGAMYQSTADQAGTSVKLKNYLSSIGKLSTIDQAAWVLVPTLSGNKKTIYGWTLYMAKNVINDVDGVANTKGIDYLKTQANGGLYYIREDYGFITYKFTADADGNLSSYEGTPGFATGIINYTDKKSRVININSWQSLANRLLLVNSQSDVNNKYIEDQYKNKNKINYYGTHCRIDYDETGAEYTVTTAGSSYSYPPNKQTVI